MSGDGSEDGRAQLPAIGSVAVVVGGLDGEGPKTQKAAVEGKPLPPATRWAARDAERFPIICSAWNGSSVPFGELL